MAYNTGTAATLAELITAKFIPEQFSLEVLQTATPTLVCADAFTHRFAKQLKRGYKVSIPVMSAVTTTEVTPGTEPTAQDAKGTAVSITIDHWYEATVNTSDLIDVEQGPDYLDAAAIEAARGLAKKVDITVSSAFSTLNASSVYGSDGQTFTDDIFIALVETLDEADVPDDGRFLIGDPSTRADLLKIDKFVRMDYINGAPTTNGKFGKIYNSDVRITNNLTAYSVGNYGVYSHPDALGVVLQMPPRSRLFDLGWKFEQKIICDAAWGYGELRETWGLPYYTRSA